MSKNKIAVILLSAVLAITFIAQTSFAFPSVLDDVPEKPMLTYGTSAGAISDMSVARAFKLLNYLNIISEEEKDFNEDEIVSRGYAVSAIAAMDTGVRATDAGESFSDVPTGHKYAAGIYQAMQYGIADNSQSSFYPNKNASFEDIAVWAIRMLDFEMILNSKKPLAVANELGFFKGISTAGDSVTMGQFLRILENILNAGTVDVDMSGDSFSYKISTTQTYLNKKYDVYLQDGILTGYKYSSMYGDSDLDPDEAEINRAAYKLSEALSVDYVGYNVCAYFDSENGNKIINLWQNEKKNRTYEIEKKDYGTFDSSGITYGSGSSRKINLSSGIRVMRNNLFDGYYNDAQAASLKDTDRIVVIDNDGDGRGDIIKAYKYTHYYIKSVAALDESIVLGNDGGAVDISDPALTEFLLNGKIIGSLEELKANDVLTALEGTMTNGKKVFAAEISRDSITEGIIEITGSDNIGMYYVLDGEYYYLADTLIDYLTATSSHKNSGNYVQVYLSVDNKIVRIKTEDDFSFGYLMGANYNRRNDQLLINVFTVDGEVDKLSSKDKLIVYDKNNETGRKLTAEEAYKQLLDTDGALRDIAVAYTRDSEGALNKVALEVSAELVGETYPLRISLERDPTGSGNYSRAYHGLFDLRWTFDGSIPVLTVPESSSLRSDSKAYGKTTGNKWGNGDGSYLHSGEIIKAYNADKFLRPKFYTVKTAVSTTISQSSGSVHFCVIDKISDAYDEKDGSVSKMIRYYSGTQYREEKISSDAIIARQGVYTDVDSINKLKKGDIVQVHIDPVGEIDVLTVYFRISAPPAAYGSYYYDKTTDSLQNELAMEAVNVIYGMVLDIDSNKALIRLKEEDVPVTIGGYSSYGNPYYVVYDKSNESSTPVTISEIKPYDIVVMRKYYNHVQDVIIIKD